MRDIGFIGAGQMAQALASGFVHAQKTTANQIRFYDPSDAAVEAFQGKVPGSQACGSVTQVVANSNTVFIAVKPQYVDSVFENVPQQPTCLFVSIVAGVPLRRLHDGLTTERVIRVMPNTPCLVGQAASGFCLGTGASVEDGEYVRQLLEAVGVAHQLPEQSLDAVTGLSGSGPAFVYQMIEAMSDGGVRVGLPRDIATQLAAQTVLGAATMVLQTGEHPGVLKDRVTSPGGTTIAGLHSLEIAGTRAAYMNAVQAATERSRELGNQ